MNKFMFFFFLFGCGLLIGCERKLQQEKKDFIFIPKNKITTIEELTYNDSRFIDSCVFIPLETSDAALIGNITQIEVCNDRYYILDEKTEKLKVFDYKGKFLFDIGKKGQGSGEYLSINSFFVNAKENKVGIFDPSRLAVHEYNLEGKFLQTVKHGQQVLANLEKLIYTDDYLYCYFSVSHFNDMMYYGLSAKDYSIVDKWTPYPIKIVQQMGADLMEHPFSLVNEELHHVLLFSDTIYSYREGKDQPFLLIETGKPNIPPTYFEGKPFEHDPFKALIEIWQDERYSPGFTELFETDRYIMVTFRFNDDFYILDKDRKEMFHVLKIDDPYLSLMKCLSMNNNKLIKVFDSGEISDYQAYIKAKETNYPEQIRELMTNYDAEEDNPILIVYYMKRSTK